MGLQYWAVPQGPEQEVWGKCTISPARGWVTPDEQWVRTKEER